MTFPLKAFGRWFAVVAALSPLCGLAANPPVERAKHVFILSIDQGSPESIARAKMPVLARLVAEGAHTWEAYTIVPSLTLPSHTSMLTGVGIQKHQIDWNDLLPEKGRLEVPTIFSLAKARGLSTAMVVGKVKFRVLQLPGSVDAFILPRNPASAEIAKAVSGLLAKSPPDLCFIHFADPDTAGHSFGVNSPQKLAALAECDAAIGQILDAIKRAGILESSVLIITADHGGHDRSPQELADQTRGGQKPQPGTHGSSSREDVTIPWIAWGHGVRPGFTITAPVLQYDTAATALWLLGVPLPENFWGRPVVSAFR